MLTTIRLQVQCFRQLSLLELFSLLHFCFSWWSSTFQQCDFLLAPQARISQLFNLAHLPPIWQCSAPATLSPTNVLPSFCTLHNSSLCTFPPFYVTGLSFLLSISPLTGSRFFNEMTEVFKPEAINFFTLSHSILNLICIQESSLNSSYSNQIPEYSALQSHCTHSRSGTFLLMTCMSSGCHHFHQARTTLF